MSYFRTDPQNARVSPNGWTQLPSGVWVTRVPLVDVSARPLFARLNYDQAAELATRHGGRIIKPGTLVECVAVGHRIVPYLLPDKVMRAEFSALHGARPSDILRGNAWDRLLYAPMATLEWCQRHDWEVWKRIAESSWDMLVPVVAAGKLWVHGALPHKSRLMGWPKHDKAMSLAKLGQGGERDWYQPLMDAHDRRQIDYGTLTVLEADQEPAPDPV